ncbi:hypothetical protein AAVH_17033 [Aphelenchoides avenae]|nr:hypothetical protein AAVH_17033 [Aphelenchus avenae]
MANTLVDSLSAFLQCPPRKLGEMLNHPRHFFRAQEFLKTKKIRKLYRSGDTNRLMQASHLTVQGADQCKAYEGFLSVSVRQHFYCRHRIRLMYPTLPLVAVQVKGSHFAYYPAELMTVAQDSGW